MTQVLVVQPYIVKNPSYEVKQNTKKYSFHTCTFQPTVQFLTWYNELFQSRFPTPTKTIFDITGDCFMK
jgi:hypothetical protein